MTKDSTPPIDEGSGPTYRPGPHWFAVLAAVFTWPLLFIGGLVTTYRFGMAVPDWPTTFGVNMFLYDMTRASWAVFGEHTHRLYGAAVGVFVILLVGEFFLFERRPWMKTLGVLALVGVIVQGVLGGYRVRLNSTLLAAIHGSTAQLYFGFLVALCVLTGRWWFAKARPVAARDASKFRISALATLGMIYAMVGLGAWLRHYSSVGALRLHAILAVAVLGHAGSLIFRIERRRAEFPELVPASRAMGLALAIQISLGVAAWWLLRPYDGLPHMVTTLAAFVRTGHQANAGLLIGSAVILTLRAYGQLEGVPGRGAAGSGGSMARELEAVA